MYIRFRRRTVWYLVLFLKQRCLDQEFLSHTFYSRMSFHEILFLPADMSQWTMCSWCVHCPFSICAAGVKLFVSAVGVPPKWLVDKLHGAGIICMNLGSTRWFEDVFLSDFRSLVKVICWFDCFLISSLEIGVQAACQGILIYFELMWWLEGESCLT